ncbi:HNH endonuclease signature motif containing protein [Halomonas elongata]|uniref:HNH endonuclease signature motif containing protein n=1 Tax=Halomonas elongata TaxID=2746 RepID=UPI0038D3E032
MPSRSPRPCRVASCPGKTTTAHGYCPDHEHLSVGWNQRRQGKSGRGGRPWRRKRERVLRRDSGLCQPCWRAGLVTPATEVDHVVNVADGGSDADDNLEAICGPCHKAKTQEEARRARNDDP